MFKEDFKRCIFSLVPTRKVLSIELVPPQLRFLFPYFQVNDDDEVEELEPPSLHEDYYKRQDTLKKFIKIVTENSQKDSKFHDQLTIELNEVTRNYSELKDKHYSTNKKAKQIKDKAVVIGNENNE